MDGLDRDVLFTGLTRPQMLLGVSYGFVVVNAIVTTELFLVFKSAWVVLAAVLIHGFAWLACLREPRVLDLWLTRARRCPRVSNRRLWRCNSYRA